METVEAPTAVLTRVGQMEHSITHSIETRYDLEIIGSSLTYTALTTRVTMGSQASGDTGLNSWITGLNMA